MITQSPYGLGHITKPGRLPEPLEPVHTCDPQSAIDRCLNCTAKKCFGNCKTEGHDRESIRIRNEKILEMILAGAGYLEICETAGVKISTFYGVKKKFKARGMIP